MARMSATRAMIGLVASALILTGCASSPSAGGAIDAKGAASFGDIEPIQLTYAGQWPAGSKTAKAEQAFFDAVTERTDGKVTFDPHFGFSLLPIGELLPGISSGVADIAGLAAPNFPDSLPLSAWMSYLGGIGSETMIESTLAQRLAAAEMFATTPELQAEFEDLNIMPLYMGAEIPADMFCSELVESTAATEGKLVRVGGEPYRTEVEALGMTPVSLPGAEIFEGLQRGVINCTNTNASVAAWTPMGITEVAPFYGATRGSATLGSGYVVNLDTWNSLPEIVQDVLLEASAELAGSVTKASIDAYAEFAETSEEKGVTFVDPTALNKVISKTQEELLVSVGGLAPQGVDAEALVEKYQSLYAKWSDSVGSEILDLPASRSGGGVGDQIRQSLIDAPTAIDWDKFRTSFEELLAR